MKKIIVGIIIGVLLLAGLIIMAVSIAQLVDEGVRYKVYRAARISLDIYNAPGHFRPEAQQRDVK